MRKNRKCASCGGAYTFEIRNSAFERDDRYILSCPYCRYAHYLVIEDGRLINEEKAGKYLKDLVATNIPTEPWLELLKKD